MRQVILNVPENKLDFFMELIHNLGIEPAEDFIIPEWQKIEVRKRIEAAEKNPERILNWDDALKSLKLD